MGIVVVALIVLLCYLCLRARDPSGAGKLRLDETRTDIIKIKQYVPLIMLLLMNAGPPEVAHSHVCQRTD